MTPASPASHPAIPRQPPAHETAQRKTPPPTDPTPAPPPPTASAASAVPIHINADRLPRRGQQPPRRRRAPLLPHPHRVARFPLYAADKFHIRQHRRRQFQLRRPRQCRAIRQPILQLVL